MVARGEVTPTTTVGALLPVRGPVADSRSTARDPPVGAAGGRAGLRPGRARLVELADREQPYTGSAADVVAAVDGWGRGGARRPARHVLQPRVRRARRGARQGGRRALPGPADRARARSAGHGRDHRALRPRRPRTPRRRGPDHRRPPRRSLAGRRDRPRRRCPVRRRRHGTARPRAAGRRDTGHGRPAPAGRARRRRRRLGVDHQHRPGDGPQRGLAQRRHGRVHRLPRDRQGRGRGVVVLSAAGEPPDHVTGAGFALLDRLASAR